MVYDSDEEIQMSQLCEPRGNENFSDEQLDEGVQANQVNRV